MKDLFQGGPFSKLCITMHCEEARKLFSHLLSYVKFTGHLAGATMAWLLEFMCLPLSFSAIIEWCPPFYK